MSHLTDNQPSIIEKFKLWWRGDLDLSEHLQDGNQTLPRKNQKPGHEYDSYLKDAPQAISLLEIRSFERIYQIFAVLTCVILIGVLIWAVSYLPAFGAAYSPDTNEVYLRYINSGIQETGAINYVAGMILDYRAFDTLGESHVLFTAICCVFIMLRIDHNETWDDELSHQLETEHLLDLPQDSILKYTAAILVPAIILFGIYIILNGHLSPGGGFSGGAIIGAGLILFNLAYGPETAGRFFTPRLFKTVSLCALSFYSLAKCYSFFTGANHLESHIPLGTPGNILSSGLILPLNIAVGLVVACTMYGFYCMFKKGNF